MDRSMAWHPDVFPLSMDSQAALPASQDPPAERADKDVHANVLELFWESILGERRAWTPAGLAALGHDEAPVEFKNGHIENRNPSGENVISRALYSAV